MKQRLKYGLIILFFILLNSSFIRVQSAIVNNLSFPTPASYNYISQRQSNHKALCDLYYIYAHTPKEITSQEYSHLFCFKQAVKTVGRALTYMCRAHEKIILSRIHPLHLRPDPVSYYIYALERIVI